MNDLVMEIARIRARNNGSWMALLELALERAPEEAREILRTIVEHDKMVTATMEKLINQ